MNDRVAEDSQTPTPSERANIPAKWLEFWTQVAKTAGFKEVKVLPLGPARAASAAASLGKDWKKSGLGVIEVGLDYLRERIDVLGKYPQLLEDYLRGKVMHEGGHVIAFSENSPYREGMGVEGFADVAGVTNLAIGIEEQDKILASLFAGDWLISRVGVVDTPSMRQMIEDDKPENDTSSYSMFIGKKYWSFLPETRKQTIYQKGINIIRNCLTAEVT